MILRNSSHRFRPIRALVIASLTLPVRLGMLPIRWVQIHENGAGDLERRIFKTQVVPSGQPLVIKTFREADTARDVFDRQISASEMCRNTIRPLHFSRLGQFIVFPFADGTPMPQVLATASFDQTCEEPVKWLRDLHSKPVRHGGTYNLTQEIDETLDRPTVRSTPWLTELARAWRVRAEQLDPVPLSQVHGDFNPGNILITEDDFTILDFDTKDGLGSALLDLAQFLTHTHLLTFSGQSPAGPETWLARRDRILCWYGQPELIAEPFLAHAVQSRRLRLMMRAFERGDKVRMDLLGRKLAQVTPTDILGV